MGFVLALFFLKSCKPVVNSRIAAVNWLKASRRRWRMQGDLEQEETQSDASGSAKQRDIVSDRAGRWFESNRWRHEKSTSSEVLFSMKSPLRG